MAIPPVSQGTDIPPGFRLDPIDAKPGDLPEGFTLDTPGQTVTAIRESRGLGPAGTPLYAGDAAGAPTPHETAGGFVMPAYGQAPPPPAPRPSMYPEPIGPPRARDIIQGPPTPAEARLARLQTEQYPTPRPNMVQAQAIQEIANEEAAPGTLQYAKNVATKPALPVREMLNSPEGQAFLAGARLAGGMAGVPPPAAEMVTRALGGQVESASSPLGVATLGAGGALAKTFPVAAELAFGGQGAYNLAAKSVPNVVEDVLSGDQRRLAQESGPEAINDLAMAALLPAGARGAGRMAAGRLGEIGAPVAAQRAAVADLGLPEGATREEIIAARNKAIRSVHPDLNPDIPSDVAAAEIERLKPLAGGGQEHPFVQEIADALARRIGARGFVPETPNAAPIAGVRAVRDRDLGVPAERRIGPTTGRMYPEGIGPEDQINPGRNYEAPIGPEDSMLPGRVHEAPVGPERPPMGYDELVSGIRAGAEWTPRDVAYRFGVDGNTAARLLRNATIEAQVPEGLDTSRPAAPPPPPPAEPTRNQTSREWQIARRLADGEDITIPQIRQEFGLGRRVAEETLARAQGLAQQGAAMRELGRPAPPPEAPEPPAAPPPPQELTPTPTPPAKPAWFYRVRSVGDQGIPSAGHAQATTNLDEAIRYAPGRGAVHGGGKPQEIIGVPEDALPPGSYTRIAGPNPGSDWIQFRQDIPESVVKIVRRAGEIPELSDDQIKEVLRAKVADAATVTVSDAGGNEHEIDLSGLDEPVSPSEAPDASESGQLSRGPGEAVGSDQGQRPAAGAPAGEQPGGRPGGVAPRPIGEAAFELRYAKSPEEFRAWAAKIPGLTVKSEYHNVLTSGKPATNFTVEFSEKGKRKNWIFRDDGPDVLERTGQRFAAVQSSAPEAPAPAAAAPVAPKPLPEGKIHFFTGYTNPHVTGWAAKRGDVGIVVTPDTTRYLKENAGAYDRIMVDNGAFSRVHAFQPEKFQKLLDTIAGNPTLAGKVQFVVAPDVPGDMAATLERSAPWLAKIREKGLPVALAFQDGAEDMIDRIPWDSFDQAFIGGSTEWKKGDFRRTTPGGLSVPAWPKDRDWRNLVKAIRDHGKPIHMGRVNSFARMDLAEAIGATSVDGTFLKHGPTVNVTRLDTMLGKMNGAPAAAAPEGPTVHQRKSITPEELKEMGEYAGPAPTAPAEASPLDAAKERVRMANDALAAAAKKFREITDLKASYYRSRTEKSEQKYAEERRKATDALDDAQKESKAAQEALAELEGAKPAPAKPAPAPESKAEAGITGSTGLPREVGQEYFGATSEAPEVVERWVWKANREGGQYRGNNEVILRLNNLLFGTYIKPRLRGDYALSLKSYQQKHPTVTHISLVQMEGGEIRVGRIGSLEEVRPGKGKIEKGWARQVDDFNSKDAWDQREASDTPAPAKPAEPAAPPEPPTQAKAMERMRELENEKLTAEQELALEASRSGPPSPEDAAKLKKLPVSVKRWMEQESVGGVRRVENRTTNGIMVRGFENSLSRTQAAALEAKLLDLGLAVPPEKPGGVLYLNNDGERLAHLVWTQKQRLASGIPFSEYQPGTGRVDPTDGRFDGWMFNKVAGKDWYTNGHFAVEGETPKGQPVSQTERQPDFEKIIPSEAELQKFKPVTPLAVYGGEKTGKTEGLTKIVLSNGAAVNSDYYDHIIKLHPGATMVQKDPAGVIIFRKDGRTVAALMGIRMGDDPIVELPPNARKIVEEAGGAVAPKRKRGGQAGVDADMGGGGGGRRAPTKQPFLEAFLNRPAFEPLPDMVNKTKRRRIPLDELEANDLVKDARDLYDWAHRTLSAATVSDQAGLMADNLREKSAEAATRYTVIDHALNEARVHFDKTPYPTAREILEAAGDDAKVEALIRKYPSLDFEDRYINGQDQPSPERARYADQLRAIATAERDAIQSVNPNALQDYIENYLPQSYKNTTRAEDYAATFLKQRSLIGDTSWRKQRIYQGPREYLKAGLIPKHDNPVQRMLAHAIQVGKFVAGQKAIKEGMASGYIRPFYADDTGTLPPTPAGWERLDPRIGTLKSSNKVEIEETFDRNLKQGLEDLATSLGIKHDRLFGVGGPIGFSVTNRAHVVTKFGSGVATLTHEIGHAIDDKYGMWDRIVNDAPDDIRPRVKEQLRRLADLREEGNIENVSAYRKQYLRKKPEQMANLMDAWVNHRARLAAEMPDLYRHALNVIESIPSLKPLLEMHPTLTRDQATTDVKIRGQVTHGYLAAPKPVARILNRHMSPGMGHNPAYRVLQFLFNGLNQAQLGLSPFHLLFTSADAAVSQTAVALSSALRLDPAATIRNFAKIPVAPVANILEGRKLINALLKDSVVPADVAEDIKHIIEAGGRLKQDQFYATGARRKWITALRQAQAELGAGRYGRAAGSAWSAAWRTPFAALETASAPIMEYVVPRQKIGVFLSLANEEIARREARLGRPLLRAERRRVLARAWDAVDDRLGQFVYDNTFWNRTAKEALFLAVRSLGWTAGSLRAAGGAITDTLTIPKRLGAAQEPPPAGEAGEDTGPTPDLRDMPVTLRMLYVPALFLLTGATMSVYQKLKTGKWPETGKDWFFPRTGGRTPSGADERLSPPTYVKDYFEWAMHPFETAISKINPGPRAISELWKNQQFPNTRIYDPNGSLLNKGKDVLAYLGKSATPIGIQQIGRANKNPESKIPAWQQYAGLRPAPAVIADSELVTALKKYAGEHGNTTPLTPEQSARAEKKRDYRAELARAKTPAERLEIRRRMDADAADWKLKKGDIKTVEKEAGQSSLQRLYGRSMPIEDAIRFYKMGTPEQQAELKPLLQKKAFGGLSSTGSVTVPLWRKDRSPDQREAIESDLRTIFPDHYSNE